jgi:O-antigen/teichoic acid export membrane protein
LRSGAVLGVAVGAANLLQVVFHVAMARMLKPAEYSLLASLLAVVMIFTVPTLALQAAVAREVAERMADEDAASAGLVLRQVWRWLWRLLVPVACALAVVSVPLAIVLNVHRPTAIFATALTLAATATLPVIWGGLQGTHRFGALGGAQTAFAVLKLALGIALAVAGTGAAGVMFGVAGVTVIVAGLSLIPLAGLWRQSRRLELTPMNGLAGHAMTAVLALSLFAAMTNFDLLVARVAFAPSVSGVYAAASLTGRTILLLPTIATTLLFPHVAVLRDRERERRYLLVGLAFVGLLGLATSAVLLAVPRLFLDLVFGSRYAGAAGWIGPLLIGMTLYALVQTYTYHFLSLDRRRFWIVLAGGLLAQSALFAVLHATPMQLVSIQIGVPAALLALCEIFDRRHRRPQS